MTVITLERLICTQCERRIDPDVLCTIVAQSVAALAVNGEMQRLHFCSAVCWTSWLIDAVPDAWVTMLLPALIDSWDIRDVQRAFAGRSRKKAA